MPEYEEIFPKPEKDQKPIFQFKEPPALVELHKFQKQEKDYPVIAVDKNTCIM